jgi:Flp pilus assembly protein TadG
MWFLANEEVSFFDSLTITAICVLIVFAMLILLALVVAAFQLFNKKAPVQEVVEDVAPVQYAQPSSLKLEDIKDEDMMVAALVATIDYHEETKQGVRVVSIKQIG